MFFMFDSLDERVDIKHHPKFKILFNNVSKYGDYYDPDSIEEDLDFDVERIINEKSIQERIQTLKCQIKENAISFFLPGRISQYSKIGEKVWKNISE